MAMYSSCLICHRDLGRNRVLRLFPVGERVAFAPETGRIWAICSSCGEWNLAPMNERWEAVEECATTYAAALERAEGDGVAVAATDGLELIQIGSGEGHLTTLRYREKLRTRERGASLRTWSRRATQAGLIIAAGWAGGLLAGFNGIGMGIFGSLVLWEVLQSLANPVVLRLPVGANQDTEVTRRDLREVRLVPGDGDGWLLRIRPGLELRGHAAIEAARYLLPLLNRTALTHDRLRKAQNYIAKKGTTAKEVFAAAAMRRGRRRTARLARLDPHIRLALEIVASQAEESRATSGDLDALRRAWKQAHELAVIQDGLLERPTVLQRLRELKG